MCNKDCRNCGAINMCGYHPLQPKISRRKKWLAGFLPDGTQVTAAYDDRKIVAERARRAAVSWKRTVTIKETNTDKHATLMPRYGVEESDNTVTYVIDGCLVTVEREPRTTFHDDDYVQLPDVMTRMILESAASRVNGKAVVSTGSKIWSYRPDISVERSRAALEYYDRTGELCSDGWSLIVTGSW
jgi:hypothetical protein